MITVTSTEQQLNLSTGWLAGILAGRLAKKCKSRGKNRNTKYSSVFTRVDPAMKRLQLFLSKRT